MFHETTSGEVKTGEKYIIAIDKDNILYYGNFEYMCEEVKYGIRHTEMMLKLINNQNTFYTLNDIRNVIGVKRIRAEYEMCWGYDNPKDFRYDVTINKLNQTIEIILYDPKDLRQYMEIRDENIE